MTGLLVGGVHYERGRHTVKTSPNYYRSDVTVVLYTDGLRRCRLLHATDCDAGQGGNVDCRSACLCQPLSGELLETRE